MIPIAAITDEFSPDLETALDAMGTVGMTGVELRLVGGRNIVELGDDEIDAVSRIVRSRGMQVVSIASPVLKCVLPDAPAVDPRFQQDVFGTPYQFADQPRLVRRALEIADRTGAGIVRVFSYWRTVDPASVLDRVVSALAELADEAKPRGITIGLENEAACNVGTGTELAHALERLDHPALKALWDPANASLLAETPYPDGYRALPPARVAHVHAKDCRVHGRTPEWGILGEMDIDWTGQVAAFERDGYRGWISLETHWRGPRGDKLEASLICGARLRDLVTHATSPGTLAPR